MAPAAPLQDGRRNQTREKLLDGALRLLVAEGYAATTTGRIAREAGIKQSSFYSHFESRDECIAKAIGDAGGVLAQRMTARRAALPDTETAQSVASLKLGVMMTLQHFQTHRDLARVLWTLKDADHAAGAATREVLVQLRDGLVADLPKFGVDPIPDNAAMRIDMLFAMVGQAAVGVRSGEYDLNDAADFIARLASSMFAT